MTVEAAIANLQAKALAVTAGAPKAAPLVPPESANQFPFCVCYEQSGELVQHSAGFADDLAVLALEYHVAREILPTAITAAMRFRDPFLKAIIADPTLTGTVSTVRSVTREFGKLEWGGVMTIGYRFLIGIKCSLTP
jgi:hypothetical protein